MALRRVRIPRRKREISRGQLYPVRLCSELGKPSYLRTRKEKADATKAATFFWLVKGSVDCVSMILNLKSWTNHFILLSYVTH